MRLRMAFNAGRPVLALVASCAIASGAFSAGCRRSEGTRPPRGFDVAIRTAEQHAAEDEFLNQFTVEATVTLKGALSSLNRLAVLPDGKLAALDFDGPSVALFGADGRLITPVGSAGVELQSYLQPSSLAPLPDGHVAVGQFKPARVTIYDAAGRYSRSFVYSPQHFAAVNMAVHPTDTSFYLFGLRNDPGQNRRTLIQHYAPDGRFLASLFPFPDVSRPPGSDTSYEPVFSWTREGTLLLALPFHYAVFEMGEDGRIVDVIDGSAFGAFKPPTRPLDLSSGPELGLLIFRDWRVHWTPIDAIGVADNRILVQRQTFDPLRYAVDVWARGAAKPSRTIRTNRALLATTPDGLCYFRDNIDSRQVGPYTLTLARYRGE